MELHIHADANDVCLFVLLKNCGLGSATGSRAGFFDAGAEHRRDRRAVRVAQLGASLSDVRSQFLTLWGLTVFYGCIAVVLEAVRQPRSPVSPRGNAPLRSFAATEYGSSSPQVGIVHPPAVSHMIRYLLQGSAAGD